MSVVDKILITIWISLQAIAVIGSGIGIAFELNYATWAPLLFWLPFVVGWVCYGASGIRMLWLKL